MSLGQKFSANSLWSRDDDLIFERALAIYTEKTESCWEKIAASVPGKTLEEVKKHYEILVCDVMMIESGCIPLPDYDFPEEPNHNSSDKEKSIWACDNNHKCAFKQKNTSKPKQKRQRGVAWSLDEHRQFLLGLEKYGKSDWRSISCNCVLTRTSTQVASHAQKYFARLNAKTRNKKRPSIHDITDVDGRTITWQNKNSNVVATSNTQTTSQPSLDLPIYGTSSMWNTQATQTSLQPSFERPTYGASTIWNTQQPRVNIPAIYGMPIINQSPMFSPSGTGMNHLAPPHMTYEVQNLSVPYSSVPNSSFYMGSVPNSSFNMSSVPNNSLNMGSVPNSSFYMSSVPNISFCMGSVPNSSFNMGSVPYSSFNMGSVPYNMNYIPDSGI